MDNKIVALTYSDGRTENLNIETDCMLYYTDVSDTNQKRIRVERLLSGIKAETLNELKELWANVSKNVIVKAEMMVNQMSMADVTNNGSPIMLMYTIKEDQRGFAYAKELIEFSNSN